MDWPHLLAYITGRVDQELLLRNEYLADENRILRAKIKGRLQLSDGEKSTLGEIARRLGRKALAEVAVVASPDTILRWFRKLVARKFDGSGCACASVRQREAGNNGDDSRRRRPTHPPHPQSATSSALVAVERRFAWNLSLR